MKSLLLIAFLATVSACKKDELLVREVVHPEGVYFTYRPNQVSGEVLVIVHGSPSEKWPARKLAPRFLKRFISWSEANGALLVAPAFDVENFGEFGGYRGLFGRRVGADDFLHEVLEEVSETHRLDTTRFILFGHSAGGQFANRYAVTHPERLKKLVLSAPGRYAFPYPDAAWPYGQGVWTRGERSVKPDPDGWLKAAQVPTTILVGSLDTQPQPPRAAHPEGITRVELAARWAAAMNALSGTQHIEVRSRARCRARFEEAPSRGLEGDGSVEQLLYSLQDWASLVSGILAPRTFELYTFADGQSGPPKNS